ncbi:MAG: hypothetical protein WD894_19415 [Pirellulales bacterium]
MKRILLFAVVAWTLVTCSAAEEDPSSQQPQRGIAEVLQDMLAGEPLPGDVIYVHVSDQGLRKLLRREVAQQTAVNDTIIGTPVEGIANTVGITGVRLVPAKGRAIVDLLFTGNVAARTTGDGGSVRVHSSSNTRFSAIKRLTIDEQGIRISPARVAARASITIERVTTDLPGLRGRIVQRIGSRRAAETKLAAESESARKAEIRIAQHFDREVAKDLGRAQSNLSRSLAELSNGEGAFRGRLRFSTSGRHLQVAIHRGEGNPTRRAPPALADLGTPDVAIHVHRALVNRVVRSTIVHGPTSPLVIAFLGEEEQRYVSVAPDEPQRQLKQSTDGHWWSLVIPQIKLKM